VLNTALSTRRLLACLRAQWLFVLLTLPLVLCSSGAPAQQESLSWVSFYRAAEYCRGKVSRPLALSPDHQLLCFDGDVTADLDVSLAKGLVANGLVVMRSLGGAEEPAIALSNIIRDLHATVVVYDYCFSACALFFLIASDQAFVLKGALVAWHNRQSTDPRDPYCTSVISPPRGGPKKLLRGPCKDSAFGDRAAYTGRWPQETTFFKGRAIDPLFLPPPDSLYVRKIVVSRYEEVGVYRDIGWTINPRYYPKLFRTKIVYEAYPESQKEVDEMLAPLRLNFRVVYDP
jgi:hypothetical protein